MPGQPYFTNEGGTWMFHQPAVLVTYHSELLHAMDMMHTRPLAAERIFRKIILACGNSHIDALLSLAVVLNRTGRHIEGNALMHRAHLICIEALPAEFRPGTDHVYWCMLENRPFLRALHAVIPEYIKEKHYERALDKINFLLKINPQDDTLATALLPLCYMHLGRYEAYIAWYQQQPAGSHTLENTFFSFLAFYKLGLTTQAKERFLEAQQAWPHMAAELLKSSHQFPTDEFAEYQAQIPPGSRQEAFVCWLASRELWQREKGLKKFIRSITGAPAGLP
ncbi:tetratricopeptide repeat protein [Chitinophaga sp. G-6-1-13]|uniref:Tetratricopeptide repeat protein n=1 Tax=Chitinophaga fulva TaxID=2728842 RepID=A0A848GKT8_9BACT|nr:tetratricopeptide repeat protein [Chitinophaga fulva]NML38009.1 tetratricopeptide repeat protein [Chitinophaga fulva]